MAGYQDLVRMIVNGELVSAGVANRAVMAVDSNVRYLKEILEEAYAGQTLIARDRTADPEVNVGQPVFYNALTQRFEKAQAATLSDVATGVVYAAPSCYVWGIVKRKLAADKVDVLLKGMAEIDLSAAVSGTPAAGMYYLSGAQSGALVQQRPPVSIPVCLVAGPGAVSGTYEVYVNTDLRDALEGHKHYRFRLQCKPAGSTTLPAYGERHTIVTPDADEEGWLPATEEYFPDAVIPQGAVFGYNIAGSALANLWPPIPTEGAYIEWNRGEQSTLLGMGVPLGPTELCVINSSGIWWLSDCYGDAPWPVDLTNDPVSESIAHHGCPRDLYMTMILWFTRPTFYNNQSAVLSLTPATGSGLTTVCPGTNAPANVGHLLIDLDLQLLIGETTLPGYLAMKRLNGKQLDFGPVVDKLKGGTNVTITGVEGLSVTDTDGYVSGKAIINAEDSLNGLELGIETVRLAGAYEVFPHNVIGLGFDAGKTSTFYGRIGVRGWPTLQSGTQMKLRFWVLARSAGSIPANVFTVNYRRIAQPSSTLTPEALPTTDTSLSISTAAEVETDDYLLMETAAFEIATGDTVMFSITRSSSDVYAGELDIIRKCAVLVVPGE